MHFLPLYRFSAVCWVYVNHFLLYERKLCYFILFSFSIKIIHKLIGGQNYPYPAKNNLGLFSLLFNRIIINNYLLGDNTQYRPRPFVFLFVFVFHFLFTQYRSCIPVNDTYFPNVILTSTHLPLNQLRIFTHHLSPKICWTYIRNFFFSYVFRRTSRTSGRKLSHLWERNIK